MEHADHVPKVIRQNIRNAGMLMLLQDQVPTRSSENYVEKQNYLPNRQLAIDPDV